MSLANAEKECFIAHCRTMSGLSEIAYTNWGGNQTDWFKKFHESHQIGVASHAKKSEMDIAMANWEKIKTIHPTAKSPVWVESRPFHDRLPGFCYKNAAKEFKNTKNPMAIVLTQDLNTKNVTHLFLHAINYDPKTKTYYDRGVSSRGAFGFVLLQGDEVVKRMATLDEIAKEAKKLKIAFYKAGGKERTKLKDKYALLSEKVMTADFPHSFKEVYIINDGDKSLTIKSVGCAHTDADNDEGLRFEVA
jgi:hypothetical protein